MDSSFKRTIRFHTNFMNSLKSNYLFNLLNTATSLLFPLITFPYAARVMGPDGIGRVNFFQSVISYVILIVSLGIPLYAVREIARVRNNQVKMNKTFAEIMVLHLILTFVGYVVLLILCLVVPRIASHTTLFAILSLSVIFTTIGCEWFYQGIEDFKYITQRAIIFRILCVILLFTMVKTKDDILWYASCGVLGTVGNNVFNFFRLRKYIKKEFFDFSDLRPFRHIKSVSAVFVLTVLSTIYISLNSIILGFFSGDEAVGYYSSGLKLYTLAFSLINALTTIMIPRMSNLVAEKKKDEIEGLCQELYRTVCGLSLPMVVGLFFASPYAVILLCGGEFSPSITVSRIVAPLLFIVGLSTVFGMQILYPMGYLKIMLNATLYASLVDIVVVFVFVKYCPQDAAAWAYLLAEITATSSEYILGRKIIPIKILDKTIMNYLEGSVIMGGVLWCISFLNLNNLMMILVMLTTGIVAYASVLVAKRDSLYLNVKQVIINAIR